MYSNRRSLVGNVKWFNSKKGYGFVNVMTPDNENTGKDFLTNFSNITTDGYKRLFQENMFLFNLGKSEEGKTICMDVMGVHGGPLLTDNPTRRFKVFPKMKENNNDEN